MSEVYAYEKPRSRLAGDLLVLVLTVLALGCIYMVLPQEFLRNNPIEYFVNKHMGDCFDTVSAQCGPYNPSTFCGPYPYARVFIPKGKVIAESDISYDSHISSLPFRDTCRVAVGRQAILDIGIGSRIKASSLGR